MTGMKSTVAFLGINATAAYAAPDALPYVLGATGVIWLMYMTLVMVLGMLGFMFGQHESEEDQREFIGDLASPGRKERRHAEKKEQGRSWF